MMNSSNKPRTRGVASIPVWAYFALFFAAFAIIILVAIGLRSPDDSEGSADIVPLRIAGTDSVDSLRVLNRVPHDTSSFLQGLDYYDSTFIETTGMYGRSKLMRIVPENGTVLQSVDLEPQYFGEGNTIWGDEIYWIIWKMKKCFVYDLNTFERKRTYTYDGQGWGLTHDDTHLLMSNGGPKIFYRDPETFEVVHEITITSEGTPLQQLNELEYIEGYMYANVWFDHRIAIFALPSYPTPVTTIEVEAWLDMTYIKENIEQRYDVVNGIAFNNETRTVWLGGKEWQHLYEVEMPDHSHINPQ